MVASQVDQGANRLLAPHRVRGVTIQRSTRHVSSFPTKPKSRSSRPVERHAFVPDGIERALEKARAAAGTEDVMVMGGANIAQQYIRARLLDEIRIHLVPVLLSAGTRLFDDLETGPIELQRIEVIDDQEVTHFRFRVVK